MGALAERLDLDDVEQSCVRKQVKPLIAAQNEVRTERRKGIHSLRKLCAVWDVIFLRRIGGRWDRASRSTALGYFFSVGIFSVKSDRHVYLLVSLRRK